MLIDAGHQTDDISEAEDAVNRVYRKAQLRSPQAPFLFRQRVVGDERATIAKFVVNAPSDFTVDIEGVLAVGMCAGGDYRATTNGRPVDVARPFVLEPGVARSSSEYHRLAMVNLDAAALAAYAGGEAGAALRVGSPRPLTADSGLHWKRLVAHTLDVFASPELLGSDLVRSASVDLLFASAITTFGITVADAAPGSREHSTRPSAVDRAMRYMDDNAAAAIGVQEIAEHARMSVRGLQAAFRRTAGITPLEYLRGVRLAEAHRELLASDPRDATVTQIAQRWGFTNISRFSSLHTRTYDESPREALTR